DVQLRPPVVPGPAEALPEPEIYVRLAEAMNLFGTPPAELHELAKGAFEPDGGMAFLGAMQQFAAEQPSGHDPSNPMLFWAYRTLGPHLRAPSLAAFWMVGHLNAMMRREGVVRALGTEWETKNPFEIAAEVFRRILAHPEGVEVARVATETN